MAKSYKKNKFSSQASTSLILGNFNKLCLLNYDSSLIQLYGAVTGRDFYTFFKNLFNKPIEAIVSMRLYPIKRTKFVYGSMGRELKIGKKSYTVDNWSFDGSLMTKTLGTFTFEPKSFIDLAPYTTIQLSVPYMDFIEIPVNEIINKTISVEMAVDLSSGMSTVYIEEDGSERHIITSKSSQIGIDIPIGSSNAQEIKRNIINTIASTALTIGIIKASPASANATAETAKTIKNVSIAKQISTGALSIANSLQYEVKRGGSAGSQVSLTGAMYPYLIISKQKLLPVDESEYAHIYGKPLYQYKLLSTLKGFTVVDDIHLENFPTATSGELDEIERLLKEGVHL